MDQKLEDVKKTNSSSNSFSGSFAKIITLTRYVKWNIFLTVVLIYFGFGKGLAQNASTLNNLSSI